MPTLLARNIAIRVGSVTPGGQLLEADVTDAIGVVDSATPVLDPGTTGFGNNFGATFGA